MTFNKIYQPQQFLQRIELKRLLMQNVIGGDDDQNVK